MLFNSFIFFFFLGIVLPVFYLLPSKRSKNLFLLLASYFFYAYWDWRFCSLLLVSTIVDYSIGKLLFQQELLSRRKILLALSMTVNLGILGVFKYFNFFAESFQILFGSNLDQLHLNIILPVGISFYTFQTMSYTIDIYRKKIQPTRNLIDFGLFVAFFPQLVAGPIERASNLLPQLGKKLMPSKAQLEKGITLIVLGLFRKVMIGDTAGRFVDHIFGDLSLYTSFEILCALILFSIQIYADFSGYSHIARGVAKLLGVELMKNFEQPYLSSNITEFWRRWHISLSSWLKDYLYISLGGNRRGNKRTYINLMLTMLLGGLWHGASWNFVIWGGLHGVYLAIHKLILRNRKVEKEFKFTGPLSLMRFLLSAGSTYILVTFSWLFFRSTNWESTKLIFNKLSHWEWGEYAGVFSRITLSFILLTLIQDSFEYFTKSHTYVLLLKSRMLQIVILGVLLITTFLFMFQSDPLPFIYFQF